MIEGARQPLPGARTATANPLHAQIIASAASSIDAHRIGARRDAAFARLCDSAFKDGFDEGPQAPRTLRWQRTGSSSGRRLPEGTPLPHFMTWGKQ